jgi:phosphoribosylglycinamide formyltransferase-1
MMQKKKIVIFISGRGSNMEAIIKNVQTGNLKDCSEIVLVFSNKPEARGLEIAQQLGIKTACIESKGKQREAFDLEIVALLEPLQPDYLVLAGYMRLISPVLIQRYRNRIINIHPADTALYQGAHAYQWAFDNKLETTKITVHFVDAGMDTGAVIAQREVDLRGAKNLAEVEQRGLRVEHVFYSEVLEKVF